MKEQLTPQQQKAKELVEKFKKHSWMSYVDGSEESSLNKSAKQCALIACNEKIESLHPWRNSYSGRKQIEEILSVKQEITKLN